LAAVLAAGVVAFTPNLTRATPQSPAASASVPPASSAPAGTKAALVDTKDFAYAPPTITVAAGDKVTFKNSDAVAHTVTADDKSFDSGNLDQNATWSHIFAKGGTYKYTCAYHSYMHGTVIVK
jgi:plastocyanin